jgi:hypothetical protein
VTRDLFHESDSTAAWLAQVRSDWAAGDLVAPPVWVTNRAKRLFRHSAAVPATTGTDLLARIRAALVFDSRRRGMAPAAPGVRSAGVPGDVSPPSWQLLYQGAEVDVDMLIRPNPDGRTMNVRGQALARPGMAIQSGTLEVLPAGTAKPSTIARAALEPTGEFALPALSHGRYDLLLRLESREIELPDLEL